MAKLNDLLKKFQSELGPDLVAAAVVGNDGLSIADVSLNPASSDTSDAAARFAMVMKLAARVSAKLDVGKVEDNLATTDQIYVLTRFVGNMDYFLAVIITRSATLGTVRMMMNEYAEQIWEAIPH